MLSCAGLLQLEVPTSVLCGPAEEKTSLRSPEGPTMYTAVHVPIFTPYTCLVFLLLSLINKVPLQCTPFDMHSYYIQYILQVQLKQQQLKSVLLFFSQ